MPVLDKTQPHPLVGRRIVQVRALRGDELAAEGYPSRADLVALELDNGDVIYPSGDWDAYQPAYLFGRTAPGEVFFRVVPPGALVLPTSE
jgi:hypothetical protein